MICVCLMFITPLSRARAMLFRRQDARFRAVVRVLSCFCCWLCFYFYYWWFIYLTTSVAVLALCYYTYILILMLISAHFHFRHAYSHYRWLIILFIQIIKMILHDYDGFLWYIFGIHASRRASSAFITILLPFDAFRWLAGDDMARAIRYKYRHACFYLRPLSLFSMRLASACRQFSHFSRKADIIDDYRRTESWVKSI